MDRGGFKLNKGAASVTTASSLISLPLEAMHQQLGGKLVPFANYNMPVHYGTGILTEHLHTRQSAGLFDVSHMGALKISGDLETVSAYLEKLLPADLQELPINTTKYSFLMNDQGGIIDDLLISRVEDGYLMVLNAGGKHTDLAYLEAHKPAGVTLTPLFDWGLLALQGPKAATVLQRLAPVGKQPFMSLCRKDGYWISRTGYTGEDGFELLLSPGIISDIFNWLIEQEEVIPVGLGARDSLRLEAGLCLYGHDLDTSTTPVEANLTWAIGKRRRLEGGFAGSDIVLKQLQQGPSRRRVGLLPECKAIAREGCGIYTATGDKIGQITSGSHSPILGKPIAMGYVATPHLNATDLTVDIRGQRYPIGISSLPFVPHTYYRG